MFSSPIALQSRIPGEMMAWHLGLVWLLAVAVAGKSDFAWHYFPRFGSLS